MKGMVDNMKKWDTILKNQSAISDEEMSIIDVLSFLQVQRLKNGISQTALAKKVGMTQPQIARIESLDTIPTFETLTRYAKGLGLQIKLTVSPIEV